MSGWAAGRVGGCVGMWMGGCADQPWRRGAAGAGSSRGSALMVQVTPNPQARLKHRHPPPTRTRATRTAHGRPKGNRTLLHAAAVRTPTRRSSAHAAGAGPNTKQMSTVQAYPTLIAVQATLHQRRNQRRNQRRLAHCWARAVMQTRPRRRQAASGTTRPRMGYYTPDIQRITLLKTKTCRRRGLHTRRRLHTRKVGDTV